MKALEDFHSTRQSNVLKTKSSHAVFVPLVVKLSIGSKNKSLNLCLSSQWLNAPNVKMLSPGSILAWQKEGCTANRMSTSWSLVVLSSIVTITQTVIRRTITFHVMPWESDCSDSPQDLKTAPHFFTGLTDRSCDETEVFLSKLITRWRKDNWVESTRYRWRLSFPTLVKIYNFRLSQSCIANTSEVVSPTDIFHWTVLLILNGRTVLSAFNLWFQLFQAERSFCFEQTSEKASQSSSLGHSRMYVYSFKRNHKQTYKKTANNADTWWCWWWWCWW